MEQHLHNSVSQHLSLRCAGEIFVAISGDLRLWVGDISLGPCIVIQKGISDRRINPGLVSWHLCTTHRLKASPSIIALLEFRTWLAPSQECLKISLISSLRSEDESVYCKFQFRACADRV